MYNSVPAAALCVYCYWMEISLMLQLFYDTQEGRQSLAEAPERPVIQSSSTQPDKSTDPTSGITRQLHASSAKQWAPRA